MPLYTMFLILGKWPLGPAVCDIWLCLDYTISNASVANLLIICFDRYVEQESNLYPVATKNSIIRNLISKFLTSVCTNNPPTHKPHPQTQTPNTKHTKILYSLNSL